MPKSHSIGCIKLKVLFLIVVTGFGIPYPADLDAGTYYVSHSGNHVRPFSNWFDASTNIEAALELAVAGDSVTVTNGVYFVSTELLVTQEVHLVSFSGASNTTITAASMGRCVSITHSNAVLDGFTITAGKGGYQGGGIYLQGGGLVRNCIVVSNESNLGAGVYLDGGGIVSNCTLAYNNAYSRGGGALIKSNGMIYGCTVYGNRNSGIELEDGGTIVHCTIDDNFGHFDGGGVRMNAGFIADCSIASNRSPYGAGIEFNSGGVASNCTLTRNVATNYGGGFRMKSGGMIVDSIITENRASRYDGGGGVIFQTGEVHCCSISNNWADEQGGGLLLDDGGFVANCAIFDNSAGYEGGGVAIIRTGIVQNCLITGNRSGLYGGGAALWDGGGILRNCTVVGNSATNSFNGGNDGDGVFCNWGSIQNCIIYGNPPANLTHFGSNTISNLCAPLLVPGTDCITNEPQFVSSASGDYVLAVGSPCIDAGRNMPWMTNTYDLAGSPRLVFGHVDLGAYEYVHSPSDFDGDGISNVDELNVWFTSPTLPDTDDDGQNDYDESIITGTDPRNPTSVFSITSSTISSGAHHVIRWRSVTGRAYAVEHTSRLESPSWMKIPGYENISGDGSELSFTKEHPAGDQMYRVRVWRED